MCKLCAVFYVLRLLFFFIYGYPCCLQSLLQARPQLLLLYFHLPSIHCTVIHSSVLFFRYLFYFSCISIIMIQVMRVIYSSIELLTL
jgi:hypothetical protein